MARLKQDTKDKILADFHIGKSQNWLAKEYECSPATINKICKGVIPKYKDKVNSVVAIKAELSKESEYQSECFDKEVNDKLRRKNLVYGITEKLLRKIDTALDTPVKAVEFDSEGKEIEVEMGIDSKSSKEYMEAIDKASVTLNINQRHANSQINVNNQNNVQNVVKTLEDFYEEI